MKGRSTACAVLENNDPSDSKSTRLDVCKQRLGGIPLILLILGLFKNTFKDKPLYWDRHNTKI
jgi:hypothetical protein